MLVSTATSVFSAIAGSGGRSMRKRFTNSAAMCEASVALPPLPKAGLLALAERLGDKLDHFHDFVNVLTGKFNLDLGAFLECFYDCVFHEVLPKRKE